MKYPVTIVVIFRLGGFLTLFPVNPIHEYVGKRQAYNEEEDWMMICARFLGNSKI